MTHKQSVVYMIQNSPPMIKWKMRIIMAENGVIMDGRTDK